MRKVLEAHESTREAPQIALPESRPRAPRPKRIDDFTETIAELLGEYEDITAQRIYEEIQAKGFEGGYTAVKDYVRVVRPPPKPQPSLPVPEYGPGGMAENDWSPYTVEFRNGKKTVVQAFAYILNHSRRKSFSLYERSDLHALLDGHAAAFSRFGGVAARCKYDNQKAVVLGWEGRQPIYNPKFLAFATYYEFQPVACRPRHPNDKPHVERAFLELQRSFLNGRRFADLEDMRIQLARWMDEVCDTRVHRKLRRSALDGFEEEREHLRPLPAHPYDTARVLYRVCSIDGFISWDGNRYAVPFDYITDILPVRVTQSELVVYAPDLKPVARHGLAPRSEGIEVGRDLHRPLRRSAADLEQVEQAFVCMGDDARAFWDALKGKMPRQLGYHARKILQLRQRYTTEDICEALVHALEYGAMEHEAVARIVGAKARPRTLAEYVEEEMAQRIEKELGESKVLPRDLGTYDKLGLLPVEESEPCQDEPMPKTSSSSDCKDTLPS